MDISASLPTPHENQPNPSTLLAESLHPKSTTHAAAAAHGAHGDKINDLIARFEQQTKITKELPIRTYTDPPNTSGGRSTCSSSDESSSAIIQTNVHAAPPPKMPPKKLAPPKDRKAKSKDRNKRRFFFSRKHKSKKLSPSTTTESNSHREEDETASSSWSDDDGTRCDLPHLEHSLTPSISKISQTSTSTSKKTKSLKAKTQYPQQHLSLTPLQYSSSEDDDEILSEYGSSSFTSSGHGSRDSFYRQKHQHTPSSIKSTSGMSVPDLEARTPQETPTKQQKFDFEEHETKLNQKKVLVLPGVDLEAIQNLQKQMAQRRMAQIEQQDQRDQPPPVQSVVDDVPEEDEPSRDDVDIEKKEIKPEKIDLRVKLPGSVPSYIKDEVPSPMDLDRVTTPDPSALPDTSLKNQRRLRRTATEEEWQREQLRLYRYEMSRQSSDTVSISSNLIAAGDRKPGGASAWIINGRGRRGGDASGGDNKRPQKKGHRRNDSIPSLGLSMVDSMYSQISNDSIDSLPAYYFANMQSIDSLPMEQSHDDSELSREFLEMAGQLDYNSDSDDSLDGYRIPTDYADFLHANRSQNDQIRKPSTPYASALPRDSDSEEEDDDHHHVEEEEQGGDLGGVASWQDMFNPKINPNVSMKLPRNDADFAAALDAYHLEQQQLSETIEDGASPHVLDVSQSSKAPSSKISTDPPPTNRITSSSSSGTPQIPPPKKNIPRTRPPPPPPRKPKVSYPHNINTSIQSSTDSNFQFPTSSAQPIHGTIHDEPSIQSPSDFPSSQPSHDDSSPNLQASPTIPPPTQKTSSPKSQSSHLSPTDAQINDSGALNDDPPSTQLSPGHSKLEHNRQYVTASGRHVAWTRDNVAEMTSVIHRSSVGSETNSSLDDSFFVIRRQRKAISRAYTTGGDILSPSERTLAKLTPQAIKERNLALSKLDVSNLPAPPLPPSVPSRSSVSFSKRKLPNTQSLSPSAQSRTSSKSYNPFDVARATSLNKNTNVDLSERELEAPYIRPQPETLDDDSDDDRHSCSSPRSRLQRLSSPSRRRHSRSNSNSRSTRSRSAAGRLSLSPSSLRSKILERCHTSPRRSSRSKKSQKPNPIDALSLSPRASIPEPPLEKDEIDQHSSADQNVNTNRRARTKRRSHSPIPRVDSDSFLFHEEQKESANENLFGASPTSASDSFRSSITVLTMMSSESDDDSDGSEFDGREDITSSALFSNRKSTSSSAASVWLSPPQKKKKKSSNSKTNSVEVISTIRLADDTTADDKDGPGPTATSSSTACAGASSPIAPSLEGAGYPKSLSAFSLSSGNDSFGTAPTTVAGSNVYDGETLRSDDETIEDEKTLQHYDQIREIREKYNNRDWVSKQRAILEDYARKKSPSGIAKLKPWQKRYFQLFPDALMWSSKKSSKNPLGILPLFTITNIAINTSEKNSKDHLKRLNIIVNETRTISIRFKSPEIRELWAVEIKKLTDESHKEVLGSEQVAQGVTHKVGGRFWKRKFDLKNNKK